MKRASRADEPWNLEPVPSWCGTGRIAWAQQTPDERKAEWLASPEWWQEENARERIAYWQSEKARRRR